MIPRLFDELKTRLFWRDAGAEFVASFCLMTAQSTLPTQWGQSLSPSAIQIGIGMGFVVFIMASSLGDFGGAHMNPAVSVALVISRKISLIRGVLYVIIQCIACITGAGFVFAITPIKSQNNLAATLLGNDVSSWQGVLVEIWITFMLVITVLGATNTRIKGTLLIPGLPIGFAVALGIMSTNGYTGASMNPARSLGPAVILGLWADHWVYWVGPIVGGVLAAGIYGGIFDRIKSDNRVHEIDTSANSIPA
ncbi:hypothetical protein LSH36_209g04037 [Paralvinella palmiformis]|uniref:Aquaporin n=1 Tax=Paralvinella palmiformis TaxID=53620 RepID=A0AAD9JP23_9ANNE|nr:hypothetical protein LSH36_209g04037 [Paralvinella palmiformis]